MVYVLFCTQGKIYEGEAKRNMIYENKVKEIRMTTMKRSFGCGFIKHT